MQINRPSESFACVSGGCFLLSFLKDSDIDKDGQKCYID